MTPELAHHLFTYVDGVLYWKNPLNPRITPAGTVAGTLGKLGYVHIQYNYKIYKAHRVIFAMFHGYTPDYVDHIDGNKANNAIGNLREATLAGNARNAKRRKDNASGVKNVCWHKRIHKWGVSLCVDRKLKHFGYFDDLELAGLVALEAREKYHGAFARHA
jgi:hypothetical protein